MTTVGENSLQASHIQVRSCIKLNLSYKIGIMQITSTQSVIPSKDNSYNNISSRQYKMIIKSELRLNWYQYFTTVAFISPDSLHASLLNLTLGKINNSEYKAFFSFTGF